MATFKNYTLNSNKNAKATTTKNEQVNTVAVQENEKSIVDLSYSHKTTFNAGDLIPICFFECYPGDHFNIDVSALIKMSIPSAPTMDAPRYDINFFFVPWKQVFPNWNNVIGEGYEGGAPVEEATVPAITYANFNDYNFTYGVNDLASYFNIPINVNMTNAGININGLPFRAYVKIWNEWYRDENLQAKEDWSNNNNINFPTIDAASLYNQNGLQTQIGVGLLKVNRLRDYFASCLPFIQKGEIPTVATLDANEIQQILNNTQLNSIAVNNGGGQYFQPEITDVDGNALYNTSQNDNWFLNIGNNTTNLLASNFGTETFNASQNAYMNLQTQSGSIGDYTEYNGTGAGTFNITDLRNALVKQHQNELDARAGTRYYEKLLSYWGIEINPLEIGRTEYIGGWHNNININNVVQSGTSTSASNTPLGTLGGLSITTDANKNTVNYSVTQYGIIIGLICVRTNITYSQGLPRLFTKLQNTDYYNPTFNGISEQPIYAYELYLDGSSSDNNNFQTFGFNQPFADLKYTVNRASGYVSANATDTYYNFYTYQNVLSSTPTLSNVWMYYPAEALDNTLLLDASNSKELINDFLADFYFNVKCSREIPAYSIPGVDKI